MPIMMVALRDLHRNVRSVRNMTQKVRPVQLTKEHLRRASPLQLARPPSPKVGFTVFRARGTRAGPRRRN